MQTAADGYKLSIYGGATLIHETEACRVELVKSSLDGREYIKRSYRDDKRRIFEALRKIDSPYIPKIYEIIFGEDTVVIEEYAKGENLGELAKRGCYCMVVPSFYTAEQILALEPQGLMLTNGPGDPSENGELISNIRKLAGRLPIFGICLGHQLFALAMGGRTKKMKYGHRGSNQPVKNLDTGRVYISSQNHGYEVISSSVEGGKLSFVNANDGTCEGFEYPDLNAYTVQFHPEACGGPMDCSFLFDKFILNIKEGRYHA